MRKSDLSQFFVFVIALKLNWYKLTEKQACARTCIHIIFMSCRLWYSIVNVLKFIMWLHTEFMLNNRLHRFILLSNFTLFQSNRNCETKLNENWSMSEISPLIFYLLLSLSLVYLLSTAKIKKFFFLLVMTLATIDFILRSCALSCLPKDDIIYHKANYIFILKLQVDFTLYVYDFFSCLAFILPYYISYIVREQQEFNFEI